MQDAFPSPCGVLVLKEFRIYLIDSGYVGFRPLAGFWFLKIPSLRISLCYSVSVPLRGSGS